MLQFIQCSMCFNLAIFFFARCMLWFDAKLHKQKQNKKTKGKTQSEILCDICGKDICKNVVLFHCPNEKAFQHPQGYDICKRCAWHLKEIEKKVAF